MGDHTRGPWKIAVKGAAHFSIVGADAETVCRVPRVREKGYGTKRYQVNAIRAPFDAALIASAPELLEALRGLLLEFTEPAGFTEEICRNNKKFHEHIAAIEARTQERVNAARAAITKTQGT